jgi:Secretion system C-terminal sorting domain
VVNISKLTTCGVDGDATVTIFAANGDLIQSLVIRRGSTQKQRVDMTQLPAGVYFARITDAEGNTKTMRITKISAKE